MKTWLGLDNIAPPPSERRGGLIAAAMNKGTTGSSRPAYLPQVNVALSTLAFDFSAVVE